MKKEQKESIAVWQADWCDWLACMIREEVCWDCVHTDQDDYDY